MRMRMRRWPSRKGSPLGIREMGMSMRPLVRVGQFAVTGEIHPKRWRLLADAIGAGPHAFVVDLGCGSAPLLEYLHPERYAGVDGDEPEIRRARERFARPGYEFLVDDLMTVGLAVWSGADVVAVSSVTHHLPDDAVRGLFARIAEQIEPQAIYLQDATPTGLLGPVVTFLDAGRHMRTEAQLSALLEPQFEVDRLWGYENPFRSFHQFLFRLTPRP